MNDFEREREREREREKARETLDLTKGWPKPKKVTLDKTSRATSCQTSAALVPD
jgi:hypothetical protein